MLPTDSNGIYQLSVPNSGLAPFYAYCLKDPEGNGAPWTVLMRRENRSMLYTSQYYSEQIDFYRNWDAY